MKHLTTYKLFESIKSNQDILTSIIDHAFIIEEEGYKMVYFVDIKEQGDENNYVYALGSSYDINDKKKSITENGKLIRVSLEIVNDVPRNKAYEIVLKEIEENGMYDNFVSKFKNAFPEYEITRSKPGSPPYINIYISENSELL